MKTTFIFLITIFLSGCSAAPYHRAMFRTADTLQKGETVTGISIELPLDLWFHEKSIGLKAGTMGLPYISFSGWVRKGLGKDSELGYTFFPYISVGVDMPAIGFECQVDYKKQYNKEPDIAIDPILGLGLGFPFIQSTFGLNGIISKRIHNFGAPYLNSNYLFCMFKGSSEFISLNNFDFNMGIKQNMIEKRSYFYEISLHPYTLRNTFISLSERENELNRRKSWNHFDILGFGYQH